MSKYASDNMIPAELRFANLKPTCDGLYPHEVLALSYAAEYAEGEEPSQSFWWDRYGVSSVQSVFRSLFQRGYILLGGPADSVCSGSMRELKEMLQARDLKVSGSKDVLAQRLIDNVSREELSRLFPRRMYKLTKKGRNILAKYEHIPYIHYHPMIIELDIYSLDDLMQTLPYLPFREKILEFLNRQGQRYIEAGSFGSFRGILRNMFDLTRENGNYDVAFGIVCELLAYGLSGLDNNSSPLPTPGVSDWMNEYRVKSWSKKADRFFPYESSCLRCSAYWIGKLLECKDRLKLDDEAFQQEILKGVSCAIPYRVFSEQECADIIMAEIDNDAERLAVISSAAEKRFRETYPLPEGDN